MRFRSTPAAVVAAFVLVLATSCGNSTPPEPAPAKAPAQPPQQPAGPPPEAPAQGGTGQLPPGHPPIQGSPSPMGTIVPPAPEAGSGAAAMVWTVPKDWVEQPPSSSMRRAQYKVPGPSGDGECVVFYFGPGQGGDAMSNVQRWASMFKKADGSSAADQAKTSESKVGDLKVLAVEVTGTYAGGMAMGMASAEEKPGYMLLGAIAEGPDSNWFFKFTGPEKTVLAQRAAFDQMLKTLRKGA